MKVPPVIRTLPDVKKKIELLEALGDIQVRNDEHTVVLYIE